jgi:hypothetical protein
MVLQMLIIAITLILVVSVGTLVMKYFFDKE